jgi:hypothetical protein
MPSAGFRKERRRTLEEGSTVRFRTPRNIVTGEGCY